MHRTFEGARLKIQRADKHIADAECAVISLKQGYVSSIETDKATGGHSIKYECPNFGMRMNEIALITGDATISGRRSTMLGSPPSRF